MIKYKKSERDLTIDEMMDCLRQPSNDKRSMSELDSVINDIIDRNPEWIAKIERIIAEQRK